LSVIQDQRQVADPAIAAWAGAVSAELLDGPARQKLLEQMAASQNWQSRLLAALETRSLSADQRKEIIGPLAQNDGDTDVKSFAAATIEAPATTQPTTAPATTQATKP